MNKAAEPVVIPIRSRKTVTRVFGTRGMPTRTKKTRNLIALRAVAAINERNRSSMRRSVKTWQYAKSIGFTDKKVRVCKVASFAKAQHSKPVPTRNGPEPKGFMARMLKRFGIKK